MKKKLLIIIGFILIICGCTVSEKNNYVVHYKNNYNSYDITLNNDNIQVEKYDIVQCVKAPCNPVKSKSFTIKTTNEYKAFIKKLFKDNNKNEVTITNDNLDDEQTNNLSNILDEDIKKSEITSKVIGNSNYNKDYDSRGYYVNNEDNKIIVTVAYGKRNTGGYSLEFDKAELEDDTYVIYVKENKPEMNQTVTMALTYPTLDIELNKMPNKLKVISSVTAEEYKRKN